MSEEQPQNKPAPEEQVRELESLLGKARELISQLENEKQSATQQLANLNAQKDQISGEVTSLKNEIQNLSSQKTQLEGIFSEINSIKDQSQQSRNTIEGHLSHIEQAKQRFEELKNGAQSGYDDLNNKQNDMAAKVNEIKNTYERVEQQKKILLEDTTDDQGKTTKSIVSQINETNNSIKNLFEETKRESETTRAKIGEHQKSSTDQISKFTEDHGKIIAEFISKTTEEASNLKQELESEIRSLLPRAGAAGLSSTYHEAKSRYAPTSFDGTGNPWWKNAFNHLKAVSAPIMFYSMFVVPLGVIVWIFYDLIHSLPPESIKWEILFFRLVVSLPLITISFFGWSSIRLYRRLYEEYNHKQRVMELYHSFKTEVAEHGNDEQARMLLEIMIRAVGDKPSLTMHRYDGWMSGMLPKNIFENISKKKEG